METEITVLVHNTLSEIKEILKQQGFNIKETYSMTDHYFSKYTLSALKKLSYKALIKNSFLVREILEKQPIYQLCYKNKVIDKEGTVISEKKTKSLLSSTSSAIDIFKSANLTNWCVIKNNSIIYEKNNIVLAVQEIENLGIFIEYEEDESMSNMTISEKRNQMIKTVQSLGLKLGDKFSYKKPYMLFHKIYD